MSSKPRRKEQPTLQKKPSEHGVFSSIRNFLKNLLGKKEKLEMPEPVVAPVKKKQKKRQRRRTKRKITQPIIEVKPQGPTKEEKRLEEEKEKRTKQEIIKKYQKKVARRQTRRETAEIEQEAQKLPDEQEEDSGEFEMLLATQTDLEVQKHLDEKGGEIITQKKKEIIKDLKSVKEEDIETLDLHNLFSDEVTKPVSDFILYHKKRGLKYILIITGHGRHSENGQAILRPQVKKELMRYIKMRKIKYFMKAPRHLGGKGAFVVVLN